jgi:hypothetical protein
LVRWLAAFLVAIVTTYAVLTMLGAASVFEFAAVFAVTMTIAWYLVVHRAGRGR